MWMQTYRIVLLVPIIALAASAAEFGEAPDQEEEEWGEYRPLLDVADFAAPDAQALPEGWRRAVGEAYPVEPGAILSPEVRDDVGDRACVTPEDAPITLLSPAIPIGPGCRAFSGAVLGAGSGESAAMLLWLRGEQVVETTPLRAAPVVSGEQQRFNLPETEPPPGADAARLVLIARPDADRPFCWRTARVMGLFFEAPEMRVTFNRVGYEQLTPKYFTVKASFLAAQAVFSLSDEEGKTVYEGVLSRGERILGALGAEWDGYYYRGNFSDLDEEGVYRLAVTLDGREAVEAPVYIGFQRFWEHAFAPALLPFKARRVDGALEDEALRLWDDPASSAALLWDLTRSWGLLRARFAGSPGLAVLQEEVAHGMESVVRRVLGGGLSPRETPEDMDRYRAALSCVARYQPEAQPVVAAARQLMAPVLASGRVSPLCFAAAMDLHGATGEDRYLEYAVAHVPALSLERVEALLDYESLSGEVWTDRIAKQFNAAADQLLAGAHNPYGLARVARDDGDAFFPVLSPTTGGSARILDAVETMAQAYRYSANTAYREFVYDQLNWLMGNNPFGACLITGLCEPTPSDTTPAGDLPAGAVLFGIGACAEEDDRPCFDGTTDGEHAASSPGYSLYNNARYISAMAYLKRIPMVRQKTS